MARPGTSAKKGAATEVVREKDLYQYIITDAAFGELKVKKTHCAWWKERGKVERLIDAYKIDCTDIRACFFAGITEHQLDYFFDTHPEFRQYRKVLKAGLGYQAQNKLAAEVKRNAAAAAAYLNMKQRNAERAREMKLAREADKQKVLPANANAIVYADFTKEGASAEEIRVQIEGPKKEDHADSE